MKSDGVAGRNAQLLVLFILVVNTVFASEVIEITDSNQLSALLKVQKSLDKVSNAVMGCLDSGKSHNVCMCGNKNLITNFNKTVLKLFADFPEINKYDLVNFKSPAGLSYSQSLKSIKKQANTSLNCH